MTAAAPRLCGASSSKYGAHLFRAAQWWGRRQETAVTVWAASGKAADTRGAVGVRGALGAGVGGVAAPGPTKWSSQRRGDALRRPCPWCVSTRPFCFP